MDVVERQKMADKYSDAIKANVRRAPALTVEQRARLLAIIGTVKVGAAV